MPLNSRNFTDGTIYHEDKGPLGDRIDYAWLFYKESSNADVQKKALEFLIYAFDIRETADINGQLIRLMAEREANKATNPEFVPGKAPTSVPFDPRTIIPQPIPKKGQANKPELNAALADKELLDVKDLSKDLDQQYKTKLLTAGERAEYRVTIHDGVFKKYGKAFDTQRMISHLKPGYAAFTLNANGELSVFNHRGMSDGIAHSSMNAGSPIVAAGELRIENGVLKEITNYSGHYQPSLFNVYRALEYFSKHHVDISQASVITMVDPAKELQVQSKAVVYPVYKAPVFQTPAAQIYQITNKLLDQNIASIQKDLALYISRLKNPLKQFKEFIQGSKLSDQQMDLATRFAKSVKDFQAGLKEITSPTQLTLKIKEFKTLIDTYQAANQVILKNHGKVESSGRLAASLSKFKEDLKQLKEETPQTDTMKNIH